MNKISHDSETPAHNQQVITACALIHHEFDGVRKIFLAKRAKTKKFLPDVFEIPGGHIDFGENIKVGLAREIKEELGVKIQIGDPFSVFDHINQVKGAHYVEVIYFATLLDSPESIKLDPADHSSSIWIPKEEISKIINSIKGRDDSEFMAVGKAFELLDGGSIDFAV